mmetsp:Transcript_25511/g.60125  ORF Transcript_25511/g.60125 Transcript_25511/m.60125 type:complete len:1022 (+) Transcript_25511:182-3247(+)
MTIGPEAKPSEINAIDHVVEECDPATNRIDETQPLPSEDSDALLKGSATKITDMIKNFTPSSYAYSSSAGAGRDHIRLKMSVTTTSSVHRSVLVSRKMPSLLHQLPCFSGSSRDSSSSMPTTGVSLASALTKSALNVVERDNIGEFEAYESNEDEGSTQSLETQDYSLCPSLGSNDSKEKSKVESERKKEDVQTSVTNSPGMISTKTLNNNHLVLNLDKIDLDNITIEDLRGLEVADGDILRAKHLNKLSCMEREHVLQDIHGVADLIEEKNRSLFVEESLKKLKIEIGKEMRLRKEKQTPSEKESNNVNSDNGNPNSREQSKQKNAPSRQEIPALEEQLGKVQHRLHQLVKCANDSENNNDSGADFLPEKQLSAKNHPMFGKLRDIGGFGSLAFGRSSAFNSRNSHHATGIFASSSGFGSSFFSPTTAMASTSSHKTPISKQAELDAAVLNSKDCLAYEQAVAQCRSRRRERNNSLFRPSLKDSECNDLDEDLYIDVEHRDFQLSFLRAEGYDTKKAAKRFLDYFEEKRRLFGTDFLTTKIQLKDLDVETKDCLESGQIQLLSERDRAGRAVVVFTKKISTNSEYRKNDDSILRAFWILSSIALEDEEIERKGAVLVYYTIGASDSVERHGVDGHRSRIRELGNVLDALPMRVAAIHWCVENVAMKQAANLSVMMLGRSNFVRVRCHSGSDRDVQYDLMTFGIPTDLFPVSMSGEVNVSRHTEFLRRRKKTEASSFLSKALALIEAPIIDDCFTLEVNDGQDPETAIGPPSPIGVGRDPFRTPNLVPLESRSHNSPNSPSISFNQQQQHCQYQPRQDHDHFEHCRKSDDFGYNENNKNTQSASFNDSFSLMGNHSSMQVQTSMQQPHQQHHMGVNMSMGVVPQFQQEHQRNEQVTSSKSGIPFSTEPVLVPGELDILLGRGRGAQNHKGNIHYRNVVETFRSRYEQIPQKGAKTQLIREVVAVIYDNGGRFLKQDGFGRWIPVDPEVARDKVSHSFRNQKRLSVGGNSTGESRKRSRDEN